MVVASPAAFLIRIGAGGVLVMNVNDRSEKTVMIDRDDDVSLVCACVRALNSLQNSMMLTPCWPSAGPTGGDGLALPAGNCSLMNPVIFFIDDPGSLCFLDLGEIELDRRRAAKNGDVTRIFCFSAFTSSTVPVKFANGPSMTRTVSPSSNEMRGLGRLAPSVIATLMFWISVSLTGWGFVPPRKPVILGVFLTRWNVSWSRSICTNM